jgi:hypothetical protein
MRMAIWKMPIQNVFNLCCIIRWPTFFRCELGEILVIYWSKHGTHMRVLHKEHTRKLVLLQYEVVLSSLVILHCRLSASNICTIFRPLLVILSLKCQTHFNWFILCLQSIHSVAPANRVLGPRSDVYEERSGGLCPTAGCVSARAGG